MKRLPSLICLGAAASLLVPRAETLLEGVVKLPPAKTSAAAVARYQQKSGAVAIPEPPTAVVYLEGSFPAVSGQTTAVQVRQESFQFMPALLPVRKGTSVVFPNRDDDYHHVFSYSKAKEFDLGRYRKEEKQAEVLFDKPGVVKVGCEIHDHMRAIVLVLDTPFFAKTDPAGKYSLPLKDVPPGKYVLKAWVSDKDIREQTVELKDGGKLEANFPGK
jgi:plastocyanin